MIPQPEKKNPRLQMEGCLQSVLLAPGVLLGLATIRDCMKDDTLRPFMGHALLHEIMPSMGYGRDVLDPLAMAVCGEMETPGVAEPLSFEEADGATTVSFKSAAPANRLSFRFVGEGSAVLRGFGKSGGMAMLFK